MKSVIICIVCEGEVEILSNEGSYKKIVKCKLCGFTNKKEPEIIRRKEYVISK